MPCSGSAATTTASHSRTVASARSRRWVCPCRSLGGVTPACCPSWADDGHRLRQGPSYRSSDRSPDHRSPAPRPPHGEEQAIDTPEVTDAARAARPRATEATTEAVISREMDPGFEEHRRVALLLARER